MTIETSVITDRTSNALTTWRFNKNNIVQMFDSDIHVGDVVIADENKRYLVRKFVIELVNNTEKLIFIDTVEKNKGGIILRRSHRMINGHYHCHLMNRYSSVERGYKELNEFISKNKV